MQGRAEDVWRSHKISVKLMRDGYCNQEVVIHIKDKRLYSSGFGFIRVYEVEEVGRSHRWKSFKLLKLHPMLDP